jgi:hypothetical protein
MVRLTDLSADERRVLAHGRNQKDVEDIIKNKAMKKKVVIFADLKQSLREAAAYEQGKKISLRVTEPPPPPKPVPTPN